MTSWSAPLSRQRSHRPATAIGPPSRLLNFNDVLARLPVRLARRARLRAMGCERRSRRAGDINEDSDGTLGLHALGDPHCHRRMSRR